MSSNQTTSINNRIETLSKKIEFVAKKISAYSPERDWEDYYQAMIKAILERNLVDPTFSDQTDAYIVKYAEFMGQHQLKKSQVYLRYVDEEGNQVSPEDADEADDNYALDLMVEHNKLFQSIPAVETEVMWLETDEQILDGFEVLSSENQKVVKMIYLGYKQTEIAEVLGISKPAVNQRLQTIAKTLKNFVEF